MKLDEVPQDRGMIDREVSEICYAVDDQGRYVLAPSAGWDPKNVANDQAWDLIKAQIESTLQKVRAGRLSPLAYHMVCHQMTPGLLARYAGFSRWRVWLHLRPRGFQRLSPGMLERYADALDMEVAALQSVPGAC